MKKTQLWSIDFGEGSRKSAHAVEAVDNTETEQMLEDLLVASPALLAENLTLVGRQLPTSGGYLDLLGIDQDGRLVVFELKRGTLTRDAVAQVLDYASDLGDRDLDEIARLIEENSGRHGVEKWKDFMDWYDSEHPSDRDNLSKIPRMVLVGLGADERALRMVSFLAESGIEIQLLTFNAFKKGDDVLLARQIEISSRTRVADGGHTKEENRTILLETAEQLRVKDLLEQVAHFIASKTPAYQYPGKTAYSFSLQEKTSEGRPTIRSYVTVYLNMKKPGSLLLQLTPRAVSAAGSAVEEFCVNVKGAQSPKSPSIGLEAELTSQNWPEVSGHLDVLVKSMIVGWQKKVEGEG